MAHHAVETRLAQPASEGTDAKDHKETDHTLREFWRSTVPCAMCWIRAGH